MISTMQNAFQLTINYIVRLILRFSIAFLLNSVLRLREFWGNYCAIFVRYKLNKQLLSASYFLGIAAKSKSLSLALIFCIKLTPGSVLPV